MAAVTDRFQGMLTSDGIRLAGFASRQCSANGAVHSAVASQTAPV